MNPISVPTGSGFRVTYSFHEAPHPRSGRVVVLHHGICHTREQFVPLIEELNKLGIHAAMIDQQSENAGFFRNGIGVGRYREGMAAAVRMIEEDCKGKGLRIGCYALHSLGALIGEEMQQRYSDLRRPTVLMAPIPVNGALPITLRLLRKHPLSYLKAVLTLDIHSLAKTPQQVRALFFAKSTPRKTVNTTTRQLKHAPFWLYCQLVLRWLLRPRIRNDGLPKLLLISEADAIFHRDEYRKTTARYAPLEQHLIEGGHDFFIEHAKEVAERIEAFDQRVADNRPIPAPHFRHKRARAKPVDRKKGLRRAAPNGKRLT